MATGYGGTYRGSVVDDTDPLQQHRLRVVVPEVYGEASVWAVALSPGGSAEPLPAIGDLIWVSFERGDTDAPVWSSERPADDNPSATGRYVGKYKGVVVDNDDPSQRHRLEVTVPEVDPSPAWATPSSDDLQRIEPPDIGTVVWIEYENGDAAYPRWVGVA
jgi:hypothetical protein